MRREQCTGVIGPWRDRVPLTPSAAEIALSPSLARTFSSFLGDPLLCRPRALSEGGGGLHV